MKQTILNPYAVDSPSAQLTPNPVQPKSNPIEDIINNIVNNSVLGKVVQGKFNEIPQAFHETNQNLGYEPYKGENLKSQYMRLADKNQFMGEMTDDPIAAAKQAVFDTAYKGDSTLTTPVLNKLEGSTNVSPQTIENYMKMPDVKQAEKDTLSKVIEKYRGQDKIPVNQFASDVKGELLPLERAHNRINTLGDSPWTQFEGINLPDELRGNVRNYQENIYKSPIKTSAGNVHFGNSETPNYFAHTRTEDVYPNTIVSPRTQPLQIREVNGSYEVIGDNGKTIATTTNPITAKEMSMQNTTTSGEANTRRVIELQSDLFQKGNLEREGIDGLEGALNLNPHATSEFAKNYIKTRGTDMAKLKPYENTWQNRIIQEEVKQAAQDGKTKLQFPTGDTAMKIEGLSRQDVFHPTTIDKDGFPVVDESKHVTPDDIKPGAFVNMGGGDQHYLITKDLGNGNFRAVSNWTMENNEGIYNKYKSPNGEFDALTTKYKSEDLNNLDKEAEQFSVSGKVDTNNPIYKFYESEVGKHLQNNYDAKRVTDPQGVDWWEVNVPKEYANAPINAFNTPKLADVIAKHRAK